MTWILNTTFHVAQKSEDEFLTWLRDTLIPTIKQYGNGICYTHCLEIMVELADNSKGYALQVNAETEQQITDWMNSQKMRLLNISMHKKFGEAVLAFHTPMRIIEP